ncbi:G-protein coupled receptor Mth2-like isoform X4 [Coccinella septempunctata]|uniref:G-protein coupled receptor Mth2-like isoform X4 n=1 Tax=Coccinella septempunctata TaxID=41139 RepID=UPI001D092789|nr:G-protein coupled receptor Mth2-like isoform X4 [Coccinella septempunctata]
MLLLRIFFFSILTGFIQCHDLCNPDEMIQNNVTHYKYKQEPIHKCDCLDPKYCVKKCCARGYNIERSRCVFSDGQDFLLPVFKGATPLTNITPGNYHVGVLKHCDFYPRIPLNPQDMFHLQEDLSLYLPHEQEYLGTEDYCLDYTTGGVLIAVLCISMPKEDLSVKLNYVGMIISMPFLLVTFLVYALLPDRNLHMKALMCYVINLLHAYIFLVTIQLTDEVFEDTVCAILGYCCVFFFLASFFWMNVICVDIFLGFRGFRGVPGVRSSERKRFILYCIYAWGMSLLIVFITFMVNHFGNVGQWFYPGVAVGQCFIRNGIPQLLYFYGPMGIIIILNVVLFTLTAMRIRRVKKDTAMLKHSESKRHSDDDQQNFNLYLKLLLAMGVNWSMELVSWAVNLNNKAVPQYVWYLSDFCNATYGVFIFFIFVFKRNIWKQLRRRYYSFMGRHHMAHSMGTTNFTKTTNDSMTVSTNDRALEESELNGTRIN